MELFGVIKLVLIIIILVASFSSYLVYQGRRRDSARTLSAIRNELSPERRLTPQERETLSPLLIDPHKHEKALHLEDDGVYVLEGEYARHGLDTNGATTWHDTIAGVEVILPFDAELFLELQNRAEVVFAGQYAIVLRLNNAFELQAGLERDKQRQKENAAWEGGVRGTLHNSTADENLPTKELSSTQESASDRVTILSQRDETPAEIESREGRGIGILSALCWTLGFIALAIATIYDLQSSRYIWMAVAALFIGLGLWQFWRRWRLPPPQKVNQVVGPFHLHALVTEAQPDKVTVQPMLGDKLAFTVPEPWQFALEMPQGARIEAELRVADCSAVRFGKQLSIDEEVRRFPLVWWGRHFTLALVGAVALMFALYASPGVRADLTLAMHWLTNTTPVLYTDPDALAAELPTKGALITLQGEGRCQVQPPEWDRSSISCQHLRWGGAMPVAQNTVLEPAVTTLSKGDFIKTRRDIRLEMMMTLQSGGAGRGTNQPRVVTNIEDIVAMVNAVCHQVNGEDNLQAFGNSRLRDIPYQCQQLRDGLLESMHLPVDTEPADWEAMLGILAEPYADGDAWEAVILANQVNRLHQRGRGLASTIIAHRAEILASEIMASQQGGILLEITDSSPAAETPGRSRRNQPELWYELLALLEPAKVESFQITGLVLELEEDYSGAPVLVIDRARQLDHPWPATLRALWLVLAMMLLLIHGPLCLRNYLAKRARTQAIQQRYQRT